MIRHSVRSRMLYSSRMPMAAVRLGKHGKPMRDPDGHTVDITTDLTDGSDGALGDVSPNQQGTPSNLAAPQGTQPAHGQDAKHVNDTAQAKPEKEVSLRDALSSAFKGTDGKPTDQQAAPNAAPANEAVNLTAPALTKDGEGKYRLADGTFASAEQVAAFEAKQSANTQQQPTQSPLVQGMTQAEAQQFQSLPAELQQYVGRTMEGLNTRAARYAEYDQLEQLIGPRREAYAQQGTNPVVAINQLYALSDFAGRDPGQFVLWFAQQNNLDLDALQDARDAQASTDPTVRALQDQVGQLTQTLQGSQQQEAERQQQQRLATVQTFAGETDAKGALVRPYLTDVMDTWAGQITAVMAANPNMPHNEVLQKAYENACWATPSVRQRMQEATAAQVRAEEAKRVEAAKAAGSGITGGPAGDPSTVPNNAAKSLREELEAQFSAARA